MLSKAELRDLSGPLYTYDVEQGGWDLEDKGLRANAQHVMTHLVKDLVGKDFGDRNTVEFVIAPDCLQYALRFARWNSDSSDRVYPGDRSLSGFIDLSERGNFKATPLYFAEFAEAAATLAEELHELDHEDEEDGYAGDLPHAMLESGVLLVASAMEQAQTFEFDLVDAFGKRLDSLRERFQIPQPE
ncbi:MAG TPA: hypothetical protein VL989_01475 [Candidatus Sulfotelmatobacter sp.]|nr:hypothetical protein [Candidatus Sulfotelmatobacter sp.]